MRLLLDTHTLLWWLDGSRRLPLKVRSVIGDSTHEILVSSASAWEIATKVRIGRLPGATEIAHSLGSIVMSQGFSVLPISLEHARVAGLIESPHRDPFDRVLAAQSKIDGLFILSNDEVLDTLGASRRWG